MFEFIKKYSNGSFSFGIEDNLKAKCMEIQYENIDKCCGVYIVYGYPKDKGDKEIVYIGSSGHFGRRMIYRANLSLEVYYGLD